MKSIKILTVLLISSLLTSCLTNKPIQSGVNKVAGETNRIYQVSNPKFKKQVSEIGVIALIGATAGGAAAMSGASPVSSYDAQGNETPNSLINIGLGAVAGLGIVSLGNYAGGQGKESAITNDKDFAEWTKKYSNKEGKQYIPLPNNRIVPKDAELDWKIEKYEDIITFLQLFPSSKRVEELALQGIKVSNQSQIGKIHNLVSKEVGKNTLQKIRKAYAEKCNNLFECLNAAQQVKEFIDIAEKRAADFVYTYEQRADFKSEFPNSNYFEIIDKNMKITRKGRIDFNNDTYEGDIKNGVPEGFGTFNWRGGDSYSGSFKNGYREGEGTYTWASRAYHKGSSVKGVFQGYGVRYNEKGDWVVKGNWQNGECKGCEQPLSLSKSDLGLIAFLGTAVIGGYLGYKSYQGFKEALANVDLSNPNYGSSSSSDEKEKAERTDKEQKNKQEDLDDCYNSLKLYQVKNADPYPGSSLYGKCPDGGCIAYKRKSWTINEYRIAQDKDGKWWYENAASWSGPYETQKEAAQRQWCGKE